MKSILSILLITISFLSIAQSEDAPTIKIIFDTELQSGKCYQDLEFLTTKIGARLSGSPQAAKAVEWSRDVLLTVSDSVFLQPVMVPHWVRGQKEIARVTTSKKKRIDFNVCALGNSVGTGPSGVSGSIVEVKNFEDLEALGSKNVKGKIVFFSRPMDPTFIHTFHAYMHAVDQRAYGASKAAKLGAVGVVVRSMGSGIEEYPHTGSLRYDTTVQKIPAIAISTAHAEKLSQLLKEDKDLKFYFETHSEMLDDVLSYNVVGEIKGSEYPEEIILVSGHLDSWDLGQGAHDDGAGCVQAIEVLRIMKLMGFKPKHTIRAVMYMNEENGLRGGDEYARLSVVNNEKHIAAIESDEGGFAPRGFNMEAEASVRAKIKSWKDLLEPYGLTEFDLEGGGADIGPLGPQGVPLIGYMPDSQRYFSYHHTVEDTFDKVNKRELELGAASMTALVYLIDKYRLK